MPLLYYARSSSELLQFNKNAKNAISQQQLYRSPQNLRDNAKRVPDVIGCQKFQFQNYSMKDSRRLENREIAISSDDAERIPQVYRPFAILDFQNKICNGRRT